MFLQFLGAAREVTGSCYLLNVNKKNILVDYGMEQGEDIFKNSEIPIPANQIDYIFLTHAHIDHSGNLPYLVSKGYNGPIFATEATCELCDIMLKDSAHIQELEMDWQNRKAKRAGKEYLKPNYTMDNAIKCIELFKPMKFNKKYEISEGIKIEYIDVGHLLGSASIKFEITENNITRSIVFSGDIGNINQPILKDPNYFDEADYAVMESTYGDRNHGDRPNYILELVDIIKETFDRGGNLVIPSFAVGRTQELLYFFREIKEKNLLPKYKDFEVYMDSPLAIEATTIFKETSIDFFDDEMVELIKSGINPLIFDGLKTSTTSDESKQINFIEKPKIIVSASGMCNAGRIRHHLKHNLWRKESTILFVGYQSVGTLGRDIVDGAKTVKLFGETIEVNAQIRILSAISGHADRDGLLKWINSFKRKPKKVFVCHGDEKVSLNFAEELNKQSYDVIVPYNGESWDLANIVCIQEGNKNYISKQNSDFKKTNNIYYNNLLESLNKLSNKIKNSQNYSNEIIRQMNNELSKLLEDWEN